VSEFPNEIYKILAETIITEHIADYIIVYINPQEEANARSLLTNLMPFSSVTYTRDEVSVILREREWLDLKTRFHEYKEGGPYRLLTLDIVLDLSIIGFMAIITKVLAEEGIAVCTISTYLKDHLLVKKSDSKKAIQVLQRLIDDAALT
jgi:hypothetical protein